MNPAFQSLGCAAPIGPVTKHLAKDSGATLMVLFWLGAPGRARYLNGRMPQTPHIEKHFTAGELVRDVVIGMSDGLTVPFALAAGLTGAIASSHLILTAGFAEIAAGSIAMGLGGYLAARSDAEHYASERKREEAEIVTVPEVEAQEVQDIFKTYGLTPAESASVVDALRQRPQDWVDFMMRFELGLEKPEPGRALKSALTIALSYVLGGMIPLSAYLVFANAHRALNVSIAVTLVALLVFGAVKGRFTGTPMLRSGLQTALIGGLAAAAAFAIARMIA
jgi:vacuolar iron transporter family protein